MSGLKITTPLFGLHTDFLCRDLSHWSTCQGYCYNSNISPADSPGYTKGKQTCIHTTYSLVKFYSYIYIYLYTHTHAQLIMINQSLTYSDSFPPQFGQFKAEGKGGVFGSLRNVIFLLMDRIKWVMLTELLPTFQSGSNLTWLWSQRITDCE